MNMKEGKKFPKQIIIMNKNKGRRKKGMGWQKKSKVDIIFTASVD